MLTGYRWTLLRNQKLQQFHPYSLFFVCLIINSLETPYLPLAHPQVANLNSVYSYVIAIVLASYVLLLKKEKKPPPSPEMQSHAVVGMSDKISFSWMNVFL